MMSDLPATDKMPYRPVLQWAARRLSGLPPQVPTEAEKRDAIRVLGEGPLDHNHPEHDPVYCTAERIFHESSQ
jgi:hypothetical protein